MSQLTPTARRELERRVAELAQNLGETESELEILKAEREQHRADLSEVVNKLGDRVELPGIGTFTIASPSVATTWDHEALNELLQGLKDTTDQPAVAVADFLEDLLRCQKKVARTGGLQVRKPKEGSPPWSTPRAPRLRTAQANAAAREAANEG